MRAAACRQTSCAVRVRAVQDNGTLRRECEPEGSVRTASAKQNRPPNTTQPSSEAEGLWGLSFRTRRSPFSGSAVHSRGPVAFKAGIATRRAAGLNASRSVRAVRQGIPFTATATGWDGGTKLGAAASAASQTRKRSYCASRRRAHIHALRSASGPYRPRGGVQRVGMCAAGGAC